MLNRQKALLTTIMNPNESNTSRQTNFKIFYLAQKNFEINMTFETHRFS